MYCLRLFLFMNANISCRGEDREKIIGVDVSLRCTDTFLTCGGGVVSPRDEWAGLKVCLCETLTSVRKLPLAGTCFSDSYSFSIGLTCSWIGQSDKKGWICWLTVKVRRCLCVCVWATKKVWGKRCGVLNEWTVSVQREISRIWTEGEKAFAVFIQADMSVIYSCTFLTPICNNGAI